MYFSFENGQGLLQGLLLGFSIAAPVGPVALLCIRRTLERGFMSGLVSGLGAAMADVIYGSIAAAGLTLVANFLVGQQFWLRLLGGAFLVCLGISTFRSASTEAAQVRENGRWRTFLLHPGLTASNPMTIFAFIAIFGGFGVQAGFGIPRLCFFIGVGCFPGFGAVVAGVEHTGKLIAPAHDSQTHHGYQPHRRAGDHHLRPVFYRAGLSNYLRCKMAKQNQKVNSVDALLAGTERLFLLLLIGLLPVVVLFLLGWWGSLAITSEENVKFFALGGLMLGLLIDILYLRRWLRKAYSLPLGWFVVFYLFYSVCMFGF